MNKKQLEYEIIKECSCGPEEFFVLISSIDFDNSKELNSFLYSIIDLIQKEFLICRRKGQKVTVSITDLERYVQQRKSLKENLDEPPMCCNEYSFTATEKGIMELKAEDRPV